MSLIHSLDFSWTQHLATDQTRILLIAPWVFLMLWSGGYVAAKYGLQFAEPMTMLAVRYASVIIIMALLFLAFRPPLPSKPQDWAHLAIVGLLIQSLYFGMSYMAFTSGMAVGTLALLLSFQPILVGLIVPRWTDEVVGMQRWTGLAVGLIGAVVVIASRSQINPPTLAGLFFATLALGGITAGSLWEKRFGLSHHPVTANLVGYSAGLLGVLPFMLMYESMHIQWTPGFVMSMTYLVFGTSVVAVGLLLAMIRAGDVSRVSALFFLVPPLAAMLAWVMLDEIMPPLSWLGVAVAALGVYIATRPQS